jgi:hypothetical protein
MRAAVVGDPFELELAAEIAELSVEQNLVAPDELLELDLVAQYNR